MNPIIRVPVCGKISEFDFLALVVWQFWQFWQSCLLLSPLFNCKLLAGASRYPLFEEAVEWTLKRSTQMAKEKKLDATGQKWILCPEFINPKSIDGRWPDDVKIRKLATTFVVKWQSPAIGAGNCWGASCGISRHLSILFPLAEWCDETGQFEWQFERISINFQFSFEKLIKNSPFP
jgi:hypothetical protein